MTRDEFARAFRANLKRAVRGMCARIQLMPDEELIQLAMERFELGEARYGPLDLNDGRDWLKEERDEVVDGAIYRTFHIEQSCRG